MNSKVSSKLSFKKMPFSSKKSLASYSSSSASLVCKLFSSKTLPKTYLTVELIILSALFVSEALKSSTHRKWVIVYPYLSNSAGIVKVVLKLVSVDSATN